MTKKEKFIQFVDVLMDESNYEAWDDVTKEDWSDAIDFLNSLKVSNGTEKKKFTDNGKIILDFIKKNKNQYNNLFKAKDIGESLGISSRTASGSMRKLVTDGYLEKIGESPTIYSLTAAGEEVDPYED